MSNVKFTQAQDNLFDLLVPILGGKAQAALELENLLQAKKGLTATKMTVADLDNIVVLVKQVIEACKKLPGLDRSDIFHQRDLLKTELVKPFEKISHDFIFETVNKHFEAIFSKLPLPQEPVVVEESGPYWLEWSGDNGEKIEKTFATRDSLVAGIKEILCDESPENESIYVRVPGVLHPNKQHEVDLPVGVLYYGLSQ